MYHCFWNSYNFIIVIIIYSKLITVYFYDSIIRNFQIIKVYLYIIIYYIIYFYFVIFIFNDLYYFYSYLENTRLDQLILLQRMMITICISSYVKKCNKIVVSIYTLILFEMIEPYVCEYNWDNKNKINNEHKHPISLEGVVF